MAVDNNEEKNKIVLNRKMRLWNKYKKPVIGVILAVVVIAVVAIVLKLCSIGKPVEDKATTLANNNNNNNDIIITQSSIEMSNNETTSAADTESTTSAVTESTTSSTTSAASFNTFSRSAPVKPADVLASLSRSTSSPRGFLAACTFNISSRPATSGLPTTIFLSNLPGLNIAGPE
jgi:hypothetical protein